MRFRTLAELGEDAKPVHLLESTDGLNSAHHLHLRGSDVVLIPQPSNDINDPLRWPTWKKYFTFMNTCLFAFMITGYVGGFAPALYHLGLEFNTPLSDTAGLILWPLLVGGLGNFFWVPMAEYVGKRPVFVISSLMAFLGMVGSAISKSFGTLKACRIIVAFGGAATEALGAAIINDIFYLHERGSKMGIYLIMIYGGNSVMPLMSGFVIDGAGWRWFCWLCAIILGLNFLAIFFFVEETRFNRTVLVAAHHATTEASSNSSEVADHTKEKSYVETVDQVALPTAELPLAGKEKSYLQKLSLWSGTSEQSFFSHFMRPYLLFVYPAVAWATISYSLCLAWQIEANTVVSFILQVPPYNWSPSMTGLINIPAIMGNLLGAFAGGRLTDIWIRRWARKHDGLFSPEARLVPLIIPGLLVPAGLLMFGFGAERHLHWMSMFVGYGLLCVCNCAAGIGMTYVMDSHFPVAAEGLLLVNGLKNVIAWGFTFGFVPWTTTIGYAKVFATMAALFGAWMLAAVPLYFYGHKWRDWTAKNMRVIFW